MKAARLAVPAVWGKAAARRSAYSRGVSVARPRGSGRAAAGKQPRVGFQRHAPAAALSPPEAEQALREPRDRVEESLQPGPGIGALRVVDRLFRPAGKETEQLEKKIAYHREDKSARDAEHDPHHDSRERRFVPHTLLRSGRRRRARLASVGEDRPPFLEKPLQEIADHCQQLERSAFQRARRLPRRLGEGGHQKDDADCRHHEGPMAAPATIAFREFRDSPPRRALSFFELPSARMAKRK